MKQIILDIQDKLVAEVEELKYVDKNWGQLEYDQPPVKFPCVLIDIENVNYTQIGAGCQQAEAIITITICGLQLVRSSALAPNRENSFETLDILDKIFQALQNFSPNNATPLMRTNQRKVLANSSYEVYVTSFATSYNVAKEQNICSVPISNVLIQPL